MELNSPIYVAGHNGLVGSAIVRGLEELGATNIITRPRDQLDLRDQSAVEAFFSSTKPAYVFLAAAKVGGIMANSTYPADFIYSNLAVQTNIIHSSWRHEVRKLCFLGSSCIYPRLAPQPMHEDDLLTGPLEPTNEWYAVAKIAGVKMCQAYRKQYGFDAISLMPTNLFGPGDNFQSETSHVMPALIKRFHEAAARGDPEVVIWGTGEPRREFLYVDDLANAAIRLMQTYSSDKLVNVGTGADISIRELAGLIADVVGYSGVIRLDTTKPDGAPRKLLAVERLSALGWQPKTDLRRGIELTYRWYVENPQLVRE